VGANGMSSRCCFGIAASANDKALCEVHKDSEPLVVVPPRSWLLREGWELVGTISAREVPSKRSC